MENHRTDSIPNDSYPVKSDRLLVAGLSAFRGPLIWPVGWLFMGGEELP